MDDASSTPQAARNWGDYVRTEGPKALEWAAAYLDRVDDRPVLPSVRPGELRSGWPAHPPDAAESFDAILADLDRMLAGITNWQHPRFFAYFATSAAPPAILAELLAATLNQVAFIWRTSPAATELEQLVTAWVAELLGLPSTWHGHIEDTASTSTLAALAAARHATGRAVVAYSADAHSSVEKAARVLGMQARPVPTDSLQRMAPERLRDALAPGDVAAVVATVGTTSTAAVDPVADIAPLTRDAAAWLHVDAAYAGSSWICPETAWSRAAVQHADSLVVNPHKWMFVPMDCSVLWTSRPDDLRAAFSLVPEYLRTGDDAESLSDYGPALGRRFRALKLWALIRCFGSTGLRDLIQHGLDLAKRFESLVLAEPGWKVVARRNFSLVCFRHDSDDDLNARLLERVNAGGEAFLSHTVVGGRYALRLAVGHARTTAADIDRTWDVLRREAAALA